jgi:RsiW-degrading membrane proteinase PrsW (M82 family)
VTPLAANPRHGRPPRYLLAGLIGGTLFLLLLVSTAISSLTIGSLPGIVSFLGLPLIALIALATWFLMLALDRDPRERRRHLLRAGAAFGLAILLWLLVIELYLIGSSEPGVVAVCAVCCVPTTAFGLWVVRRLDRNEKEPWRLMLVAAAWGGIVAVSLVIWANTLLGELAGDVLVPGPGLDAVTAYGAGFFEEIAKGLAVLLLYLVMRNEFDDVVDGIIYGAAVGLGFNFMESILYMSRVYEIFNVVGFGGAAAFFQWYFRQILGLFFGHATYTALTGAGIGIARQLPRLRQRLLVIACGWLLAIAAHFAWDAWIGLFPIGEGAAALLGAHLRTLFMDGPFTAVVLLLLGMGLTFEGQALRRQLELEAAAGTGAVAPAEVPVLASPWRRLRARWAVFGRHGFGAYRRLLRLQQAQLNLAMERWHRERQEIDEPLAAEDQLRERVLALRG